MAIQYESELNSEQIRVVSGGDGPCLVLAGAGTGKTRTIVYRVAYLLERGITPDQILLVTFTNKAAREMLTRIEVLLGTPPHGLWGGTFHHVGSRTLRKFGARIGIPPNYTIYDQDDRKDLLQTVMSEYGIDKKSDKQFPKVDLIQELMSFASNSLRPLSEIIDEWIPKHKDKEEDIIKIAEKYGERKRERAVLDFDDLLSQWLRLLRERPEVKTMMNRKFEYILVDEYQDTNRLQGAIVEELAGTHKNVLVVGDDAQSIYAFRAATVENIMRFPEIFTNARVFRLEQNYRSTQAILDLANAALRGNRRQFQKELKSARLFRHPEQSEEPALSLSKGSRDTRGERDSSALGLRMTQSEKPELISCADTIAEARFIVDRVLEFHDAGESLLESAVLFRAAYHGMQLELELQKNGVPYVIRGGIRFFEQAHIKDIVAYLKVVENPRDEIAWTRILKLEAGIGDKTATVITQALQHGNTLTLSEKVKPVVQEILQRVERLKTFTQVDKMILYLLKDFYEKYAQSMYENARDRLEDLEQLALFAVQYETLGEFLADATLSEGFRGERAKGLSPNEAQGLALEKTEEYLVLSTIHQAKGLEWKNVFVVGLIDGQFPHYKAQRSREEIEEERRLFYVAVTRAKERLFLTYPAMQAGSYGAANQPSLFVRELPTEVYRNAVEDMDEIINVE